MHTEMNLLRQFEKFKQTVSVLKEQTNEFRRFVERRESARPQKEYKDRLFKFIFGNPGNKQWTLSLYNAADMETYLLSCRIKKETGRKRLQRAFEKCWNFSNNRTWRNC